MSTAPVEFRDIQGIVRFGYGPLTEASFLLLNIRDAGAACRWLESAPVATAEEMKKPPVTALQVAFTRQGLEALGVSDEVLAGFSAEFCSGMSGEESRSRRLGDIGSNSPEQWRWGGQEKVPHMLLMAFSQPGHLEAWMHTLQGSMWDAAFEVVDTLSTSDLHGTEPFGFNDGISQPSLDWARLRTVQGDQLKYGNVLSLGEFLLGYPNEYGKYTDRPLLSADSPSASFLPSAEDQPLLRDFGRNGTFVVFRHLQQDVRGFWRFLDRQARSDPQKRGRLAEAIVGRQMDGTPLVAINNDPIQGTDPKTAGQNQFTFNADENGVRCPLGAHIRRANPRNADLPESNGLLSRLLHTLGFENATYRDDVIASTRFHRILRRGREYGRMLTAKEAIADGPDTGEHGIHFICIVGNISRQFEFIQNSWIMGTKFDALTEESDPLLGNRTAITGCPLTSTFSQPQETGARERVMDLPQFVTVRGGAYFFLPSLSCLRYLTKIERRLPQSHNK